MTKIILFIFLLFLNFAVSVSGQTKPINKSTASYWLTPQKMTPLSFMQTMRIKDNQVNKIAVVTMVDSFPKNWLTKNDIDTLIKLVNSKEKCNCFLNPLSSYIRTNDYAEVGAYATWLIKAYKEKRKINFGLHACPKTNKVDADKLIQWWTQQKN